MKKVIMFVAILFLLSACTQNIENYSNMYFDVHLIPVEDLSYDQLLESKLAFEKRLEIYRFFSYESFIKDDKIVLKLPISLKEDQDLLNEILQPSFFEAKIGAVAVFGWNNTIDYVCRSPDCAGVDLDNDCIQIDVDEFSCTYRFSFKISEESAKKIALATKDLDVVENNGSYYLNESLKFYLDGELFNELNIESEIKGKEINNIQLSGVGFGKTQYDSAMNSLDKMRELQEIFVSFKIPYLFEMYIVE